MESPILEFEERLVEDLRKVRSCSWSGHLIYQAVREGMKRGDARLRSSAQRDTGWEAAGDPESDFWGKEKAVA